MMDLLGSLLVPSQEELADTYDSLLSIGQPQPPSKRRKVGEIGDMGVAQELVLPDQTMPLGVPSTNSRIMDTENVKPPPLAKPAPGGFSGLDLQDIDDFDRLYPHIPKPKSTPKSKSSPNSGPAKLVPIMSNKASSDSVIKLHELCQSRGLDHFYEFSGEQLTGGFSTRVQFGNQTVQTERLFPSKKLAKAAAATIAVAAFSPTHNVAGVKRKAIETGPEADKSENWAGLLVEYSQKNKRGYPEYEEYVTDTTPYLYASTVFLPGTSATKFASTAGPFKSKSDAKAAAAKEAVLWLRAEGLIPESLVKRCKSGDVEMSLVSAQQGIETDIDGPASKQSTASERLHFLVASLKLVPPRLDCRRAKAKDGEASAGVPLYDAALYFESLAVAREPRLAGPIGLVERVHGQKKAREACCERALPLLEEIRRSRMG